MSFGGFGNTNNNTNTSGFGGFGASNTGFGANNTNTSTSGGSLFGGGTATAGGFGGFGANNSNTGTSPFGGGAKPAFGAPATTSSGGGLFGGGNTNTTTTGAFGSGGGFGSTANTGTGFGSTTGGGTVDTSANKKPSTDISSGLFGANKPATTGFGATNTGGSLFGGGGNTTGGFGASTGTTANNPFAANTATSTGFGASTTGGGFGGFGASQGAAQTNNNNGTAAVPFQAVQEKDGTNTTSTVAYQSITFQDPYKNKSFEELRVEDYAQGRRFGNTNGQAGAFGQSTGFGGFGQTNTSAAGGGGMFGNTNTNTATSGTTFGGFGANTNTNTNTTGGFGSSTGGGLFGNQNKPAGGLFGNTGTSAPAAGGFGSTAASGGGLFGGNTSGGFGTNTGTSTTGGGLFGNTNQQQPAANPFASSTTTTGGGLFGNQQNKPAGGGLFGNTSANTGGGLFGANNTQQQPQANPFGQSTTNTGGGLFGNNQQQQNKPAFGGFGASTNTGGAFGGATNTGGGLFGNNNQQSNTGGGLFGNQNQNKPASTGLFGSSTAQNTGGGLFGGANNNQNTGSSLFGGANANAGGSLFGNNQNKPAGSSLFGGNTSTTGSSLFGNANQNQNNNAGSSLFGGMNNQQNQQNAGSSLFGNSNNQQQQQSNQLHASITGAPYGNEQLFSSLIAPSPPVGPLATPLTGARPPPRKTPSLMTSMRLNSPVYTPQRSSIGRAGGYGFSYSTYGTPGSAFSGSLTPGASSMLRPTGSFSSGLTNRLSKSISMGNLRGDGTPGEGRQSLLRESALSPPGSGVNRYGSGSVRKLNIDRSLRTDLFGSRPESEQRRPHFDEQPEQPEQPERPAQREPQPSAQNALVRTEESEEESPGLMRAPPQPNGGARNQPEMSQVNGGKGALSSVPEDSAVTQRPGSAPATQQKPAPPRSSLKGEVGDYYTQPALKDLKNMSRQQLQKLGKFVVGREGVGRIEFGPCDLSTTNLDDICGNIVRLNPRSATVYQDDADKPSMGKSLNVPSTIFLENSWPRSHGGKKAVSLKEGREYEKHITRLKRVGGTKFVNYDADTGVWQFTVEHFTTYGLDDDDDDEDFTEGANESSGLSDAPVTPGQHDETMQSIETGTGEPDDTFEFKLHKRSQKTVPGGFDEQGVTYDYDDPSADEEMNEADGEGIEAVMQDPFTSLGGAVQAPSPGTVERYHSSMMEEDQTADVELNGEDAVASPEMPGSFVAEPKMLRSILKPSMGLSVFDSPAKMATGTWEEQLQRTMSPKKRDRQALKDMQQSLMRAQEQDDGLDSPFKRSLFGQNILDQSMLGESYLATKSAKKSKTAQIHGSAELGKSQAFRTSMDIMNSLWANEKTGKKANGAGKGFEYPYLKKARFSTSDELSEKQAKEIALHDSFKPSFSANGTIVYGVAGSAPPISGELEPSMEPLVGEHRDVRFAKFVSAQDVRTATLEAQKQITTITLDDNKMPFAVTDDSTLFVAMAQEVKEGMSAPPTKLQQHELAIWELCSVLFDPAPIVCAEFMKGVPRDQIDKLLPRMKLDAFTSYWSKLVATDVDASLKKTKTAEDKALLLLTKNDVAGACEVLVSARDFRLATLIAQLPTSQAFQEVMAKQIEAWQRRKEWSEMSDAVRALYTILSGEVCVVPGQSGAAEDRASEFHIAERFDLSWRQSLALRLCYGGHTTLEEVLKGYCTDLGNGREFAAPITVWDSEESDRLVDYEDTLMGVLRLTIGEANPEAMLEPMAVSGSLMNSRLAWQLSGILGAKEKLSLPATKMAQLTASFAAELEAAGEFVESAWVLIHLPESATRRKAIAGLLQRCADKLADPGQQSNFEQFTQELQIPQHMVLAAKAMYAKAAGDAFAQARWLLRAGLLDEAHIVLCTVVGPQAVIEQDYTMLSQLVSEFPKRKPETWEHGGQAYEAFARLQTMSKKNEAEEARLLRTLRRGLAKIEEGTVRQTLEQRVAVIEMGRYADEVSREIGDDKREVDADPVDVDNLAVDADMLEGYRRALGVVA